MNMMKVAKIQFNFQDSNWNSYFIFTRFNHVLTQIYFSTLYCCHKKQKFLHTKDKIKVNGIVSWDSPGQHPNTVIGAGNCLPILYSQPAHILWPNCQLPLIVIWYLLVCLIPILFLTQNKFSIHDITFKLKIWITV